MFDNIIKITEFGILLDILEESGILHDLDVPDKTENVLQSNSIIGQKFTIKHNIYPKYFWQLSYYHKKWYVQYNPGNKVPEDSYSFEKFNAVHQSEYGIHNWIEYLKEAVNAERRKEKFFKKLYNKTSDLNLNIDEPFSEKELNETLPNAFNEFKTKINASEIPAEAKQKLIEGTDKYLEKAKSGNYSKRDLLGSILLFFGGSLAEYGLHKFYDFVIDAFIQSIHYSPVIHPLITSM